MPSVSASCWGRKNATKPFVSPHPRVTRTRSSMAKNTHFFAPIVVAKFSLKRKRSPLTWKTAAHFSPAIFHQRALLMNPVPSARREQNNWPLINHNRNITWPERCVGAKQNFATSPIQLLLDPSTYSNGFLSTRQLALYQISNL